MKTYYIGICDDDILMINTVKARIENHFLMSSNKAIIRTYESAKIFLESNDATDYLFLDIEMNEMNGIDLKEKLQMDRSKIGVIFVTSYKQYKDEAFGKNVFAYIEKDKLNRITEILTKIEKNDTDYSVLKISDALINTRDIYYLKADGGYVRIVIEASEFMFCGSLNELLKRINNDFFIQIHRSYIVNMKYVENKGYDFVILRKKGKIPLSRKYKDDFENKFFKFLREG